MNKHNIIYNFKYNSKTNNHKLYLSNYNKGEILFNGIIIKKQDYDKIIKSNFMIKINNQIIQNIPMFILISMFGFQEYQEDHTKSDNLEIIINYEYNFFFANSLKNHLNNKTIIEITISAQDCIYIGLCCLKNDITYTNLYKTSEICLFRMITNHTIINGEIYKHYYTNSLQSFIILSDENLINIKLTLQSHNKKYNSVYEFNNNTVNNNILFITQKMIYIFIYKILQNISSMLYNNILIELNNNKNTTNKIYPIYKNILSYHNGNIIVVYNF